VIPSELVVLLAGEPIGVVRRHAGGRLSFVYDEAWQEAGDAYPLSLSLPLIEHEHEDAAIRAYLEGLLPDRVEVRNSWGKQFHVSGKNAFGLLAHVGEDCPGAVQFVSPERVDALRAVATTPVEWLSEAELAARLRNAIDVYGKGAQVRGNGYFSLAGAQPKTVLYREGNRWASPSAALPSTHLLKPPAGDLDSLALNEHLCLLLAEELGLSVARSEVLSFEGEVAIVVERFDRVWGADGRVRRVHQEDLCQALAVLPQSKYEYEGGPGAPMCGRLLMQNSADPDTDLGSFVDALALNWVILGTDGHAKNYACLYPGGPRPRLAPLYDIISVLPYPEQVVYPGKARLAMRIGKEYRAAAIRRRHWETFAQDLGVDEEPLLQRVAELVAAVPSALERVRERVAGSDLNGEFGDELSGRIKGCVPARLTALQ
jgi:serine/threonine-protein kinase HipA